MKDIESLRRDLASMVNELREAVQEIGTDDMPQTNVVSNARDRLRYISALTEQAAGRTLTAAEAILPRLKAQSAQAAQLQKRTRSTEVRTFLASMQAEHEMTAAQVSDIILAQEFQDLVGQVVNKLAVTVQKMEDHLVHMLIEEDESPGTLSGPAVRKEEQVSQADIDNLFD